MNSLTAALVGLIVVALALVARSLRPIAIAHRRANARAKKKEFVIGFGPTGIEKNSTATFEMRPRGAFEGTRLIVPSSLAAGFMVSGILVGGKSVMVSNSPIPAVAFSEMASGVDLKLPKTKKGDTVEIVITNVTDSAKTFSAALIGFMDQDVIDERLKRRTDFQAHLKAEDGSGS